MMRLLILCVGFAFVGPASAAPLRATVPGGFTDDAAWVTGLSYPTAMEFAPDGRLFVCQQAGQLRVISAAGSLLGTPFLSLSVDSAGERGLLGVTFAPDFATAATRWVYVYYTVPSPVHNRISRFQASGDVAVAGSEQILVELEGLSGATNHNGGAIHFGPDGKLYVAVGDNANPANSQTLGNRLGKILRLNPDGSIPADNPFYTSATGNNRAIWGLGLRNPFTFGIHPSSGRLFINDVGQDAWEEVNDGIAGSNYGWPTTEGDFNPSTYPNFRRPIHAYSRESGGCIAGAAFYPGSGPFGTGYHNRYFYADFSSGWIRVLNPADHSTAGFASGVNGPVDLKVGADGRLYYLARVGGAVGRVTANTVSSQPPSVGFTAPAAAASVSGTVEIHARANDPDVGPADGDGIQNVVFQLRRAGTVVATHPEGMATYDWSLDTSAHANGTYALRATATDLGGATAFAERTITISNASPNQPPLATITTPAAGTTYVAGTTESYSGTGTDPEQGALGGAAFTWRVDFHHDSHVHPHLLDTSGATSGSFSIPGIGETAADVWYRIHLTVTDAGGLTSSAYLDLAPVTVTLTIDSAPAGLQVTLDGQPHPAPYSVVGVVGLQRTLGVVAPQSSLGSTYAFDSWSDGGAASHTIATPGSDTTWTATYAGSSGPATAFLQGVGGDNLVPMEAENASTHASQGGHDWVADSTAGFSGVSALRAIPDSGANHSVGYSTTSPRLDFPVNFTRTGTHYVWVRGLGPTGAGADDSVHVGLDGAETASSDAIGPFTAAYSWVSTTLDGGVATIDVISAGVHSVNVWMREDGFIFDKIVLTANPAYVPTGAGPEESLRAPVAPPAGLPVGSSGGGDGGGCGLLGVEALLLLLLPRRRRPVTGGGDRDQPGLGPP